MCGARSSDNIIEQQPAVTRGTRAAATWRLSQGAAGRIFHAADRDQSGALSMEEYKAMEEARALGGSAPTRV